MKMNKIAIFSLFALSLVSFTQPSFAVGESSKPSSGATLSFDQIKMAAQSGDADAQYALGYMYYYGKSGAPKDAGEAKKWIAKAAGQRQAQAMKALDLMNKQMGSGNDQAQPQTQTAPDAAQTQPAQRQAPMQQKSPASALNEAAETINNTATPNTRNNKESALRDRLAQENKMTLVDMRSQKENSKVKTSDSLKESPQHAAKPSEAVNDEQETFESSREATNDQLATHNKKESGKFTLQLLGSYHKDLVAKEMMAKHLNGKANIYQTKFNNKDWYVLLYGRYQTQQEAKEIAKSLENRLDMKPWVKPTATIQTYKKLK